MATPPEPQELTAGEEVWLCEQDRPRHKVYSVDPLEADQARMGADFQVYFKGATTGRMLAKHVSHTDKIKAVVRHRPPTAGEFNGKTADEEDSRG